MIVLVFLLLAITSLFAFMSAAQGVLASSIQWSPFATEHRLLTMGILSVLVGALGLALWRLQSATPAEKQAAAERNRQRERAAMLARVQKRVKKEQDDSLQGAALQALDLRAQSEAVLALTSTQLTQPNAPVKPEVSIVHAYEEAEHKLLILGEPGAGKSTLLRQLALHLLAQAQKPISDLRLPIIFQLSSWAENRQALGVWMVEELRKMYQINQDLAKPWLEADDILPLLDGWDEVAPAHRRACADAINAYLNEHGLVPTVVCSRSQEYWSLSEAHRMKLVRAVEVQPLSQAQITRILNKAGNQLEGLRQALAAEKQLRELTSLPLMLNLMLLAYQGCAKKTSLSVPRSLTSSSKCWPPMCIGDSTKSAPRAPASLQKTHDAGSSGWPSR